MGQKLGFYFFVFISYLISSFAFSQTTIPAYITVDIKINTQENDPKTQPFDEENYNTLEGLNSQAPVTGIVTSIPIIDFINNAYGNSPNVTLIYPASVNLITGGSTDIIVKMPFVFQMATE
jgi:hypothetical protein